MSDYWADKRVVVTGGAGFLGQHVCAVLRQRGCGDPVVPRSAEYALTRPADVAALYDDHQPDVVLHLAARVGGIGANRSYPGTFLYANLMMGLEMLEQARLRFATLTEFFRPMRADKNSMQFPAGIANTVQHFFVNCIQGFRVKQAAAYTGLISGNDNTVSCSAQCREFQHQQC